MILIPSGIINHIVDELLFLEPWLREAHGELRSQPNLSNLLGLEFVALKPSYSFSLASIAEV